MNPSWWLSPFDAVVHTRFQVSYKEFAIKSMKDVLFSLKIKQIHSGDEVLFWIALLDAWFFGGRHNFSSLSLVSASLVFIQRLFSLI